MAESKGTRFARNAEQLARAFELPLAPRKRKGSLATVSAWIAESGFPKKTRNGWVVEEVRAWREAKEEKELSTLNAQRSTSNQTEFPSQPDEDEREKILSRFPLDYQTRLKGLYRKWLAPDSKEERTLTNNEHKELVAAGLVKQITAGGESADPGAVRGDSRPTTDSAGDIYDADGRLKNCRSQHDLAGRLQFHFQGRTSIIISEQQLSKWRKYPNSLPNGVPPVPSPVRNEWPTQEVADWFQSHMLPHYPLVRTQDNLGGSGDNIFSKVAEAEAREKINRARLVEIDLENKERTHSDKWIATQEAISVSGRMVSDLCGRFQTEVERIGPAAWRDWAQSLLRDGQPVFTSEQVSLIESHARTMGEAAVTMIDDWRLLETENSARGIEMKAHERVASL